MQAKVAEQKALLQEKLAASLEPQTGKLAGGSNELDTYQNQLDARNGELKALLAQLR